MTFPELLWKYLERFDKQKFDERLTVVSQRLDALTVNQQQTNQFIRSSIMPGIDDLKAQEKQQTATLRKVFDEVSGMSARLKELQEQGDAKIAEAVAAARAEDKAALDASLAELQGIQDEQSGLIEKLDAINEDKPAEPAEPTEPTEPAEPTE